MLRDVRNVMTTDEKLCHAFGLGNQWSAVDPDSGAFLMRSNGRRMTGRPSRWILILPNKTVKERGGLFANSEWNDGERKFITAYTLAEVLPKAQSVLDKMLAKRQAHP